MRARAAVLRETPGPWHVEDVEIDPPHVGEVLVQMAATGLCHTDYHYAQGDMQVKHLPMISGHEGAGIIREVGPGVTDLAVGDHVVTTFAPGCGRCRLCGMGLQFLCSLADTSVHAEQPDGTFRVHTQDGLDVGTSGMLGTFAEWQVFDRRSLVKVDPRVPLTSACLVACGVTTGFGAAAFAGGVGPGDTVLVVGAGGVGMNAVQGAQIAGAAQVVVADPAPLKQQLAPGFGATECHPTIAEAAPRLRELTEGRGADVTVITLGTVTNEVVNEALAATRKGGTVVVAGVGTLKDAGPAPELAWTSMVTQNKRLQGTYYGGKSPVEAMPRLFDLYLAGRLRLDELISHEYALGQINEAYADLNSGRTLRGIVRFT